MPVLGAAGVFTFWGISSPPGPLSKIAKEAILERGSLMTYVL
jgi:hypothetical protein